MNRRLILPIALAALFLGACEETPTETAQDVSQARQEASKDVAAAEAFLGPDENAAVWADYAHTFFNVKEFLYVP